MNILRWIFPGLPLAACLCLMPLINAGAADIQVYKGELRVLIPGQQVRNRLLLQYRTKTREVVRIGVKDLTITNMTTVEVTRLDDRTTGLTGQVDNGYLSADIVYNDVNFANDEYRVEGDLIVYLAGSQQTRNFSIYLKPESGRRLPGSGINWGIDR